MAVTVRWYPRAFETGTKGEWDFDTDDIRLALLTSSYTYSDAHDYFDDITNELTTTGGYTANGKALTTTTVTWTDDASATAWSTGTSYAVGDVVRPTSADGHVYKCIIAGTSHATTEPTWDTTPGQDTADNTVTWTESGRGYVVLDADNVSWTSATFTTRYGVLYDRTPATDATRPLLGFIDFGQDESPSSDTFSVNWHDNGILRIFPGYGGT